MSRLARPLLYLGIAGVVFGLSKLHASRIADPPYDFTGSSRFAWAIGYIVALVLTAYGVGLPDLTRSWRMALASAVVAAGLGAAAISVLQLLVGDALLPRAVVFGSAILLVPWYVLCASIASGGRARDVDRDRVLLVGAPTEAELLAEELEVAAERPAVVAGVVPPGSVVAVSAAATPLLDALVSAKATLLVLNRQATNEESIVAQAAELHERGIRVRTLSLFYEEWLGKLPLAELERVSLMFDIGEVHRARYGRVKRVLDVALALPALLVLLVLLPFVALFDLLGNRGRIFFTQPRVGKNGECFTIYKFRTMIDPGPEGDVEEGRWTSRDDARVTTFGRLMRRTHIDELPQALNILRGDLSVVGPRPEQPHYVEELSGKLPFYGLRHLVRPGLTGWAQVKYHYGSDEADAMEKLQFEFYYLRHQRLVLDCRIIGRTVRSVLGREGR